MRDKGTCTAKKTIILGLGTYPNPRCNLEIEKGKKWKYKLKWKNIYSVWNKSIEMILSADLFDDLMEVKE